MITFLWIAVIALFIVGLTGTVIPGIPGISLIFAGTLLYAFVTNFSTISVWTIVTFGVFAAVAMVADYVASIAGAKIGGGGLKAAVGAGVGAVMGGLVLSVPGILIGAFLGGFVGALFEGVAKKAALKVAFFSALGILGSAAFQLLIGISMVIAFFATFFL